MPMQIERVEDLACLRRQAVVPPITRRLAFCRHVAVCAQNSRFPRCPETADLLAEPVPDQRRVSGPRLALVVNAEPLDDGAHRALSSVVLPVPVPPEMRMFWWCSTACIRSVASAGVSVPTCTRSVRPYR